mmetsp:Transcript_6267/g.9105  ORF Transcript_6267/g.9105 Transcript_6267/m.9105 type:complete len:316 (+) Transcript_6267:18-965(+)
MTKVTSLKASFSKDNSSLTIILKCLISSQVILSCSLSSVASLIPTGLNKSAHNSARTFLLKERKVTFEGSSSYSIDVNIPSNVDIEYSASSFSEFLESDVSLPVITGSESPTPTDEYSDRFDERTKDGRKSSFYVCPQPSVGWFGIILRPSFVNRIDRAHHFEDETNKKRGNLEILIVDSKTETSDPLNNGNRGIRASLLNTIMAGCSFEGGNTISWMETTTTKETTDNYTDLRVEDTNGEKSSPQWRVTSRLNLRLCLTLPQTRFPLLLPPGFETIGNRIVQNSCEKRVKETLNTLQEQYVRWATANSTMLSLP